MSLLDRVKGKIKGKDIDQEINDVLGADARPAYSRRVLEANQKFSKTSEPSPGYFHEQRTTPAQGNATPQGNAGANYGNSATPRIISPFASRQLRGNEAEALDEDEFTRRRSGMDASQNSDNMPVPRDIVGLPGTNEPKRQIDPLGRRSSFYDPVVEASLERTLENIVIGIRDLRAQNNHIIELLRNIQDRLST